MQRCREGATESHSRGDELDDRGVRCGQTLLKVGARESQHLEFPIKTSEPSSHCRVLWDADVLSRSLALRSVLGVLGEEVGSISVVAALEIC